MGRRTTCFGSSSDTSTSIEVGSGRPPLRSEFPRTCYWTCAQAPIECGVSGARAGSPPVSSARSLTDGRCRRASELAAVQILRKQERRHHFRASEGRPTPLTSCASRRAWRRLVGSNLARLHGAEPFQFVPIAQLDPFASFIPPLNDIHRTPTSAPRCQDRSVMPLPPQSLAMRSMLAAVAASIAIVSSAFHPPAAPSVWVSTCCGWGFARSEADDGPER